jgi:putative oxidoreductase
MHETGQDGRDRAGRRRRAPGAAGAPPRTGRWRPTAAAVLGTASTGTRSRLAAGIRVSAGIIFLFFGLAKFASHAAEVASFRHYPLPAPGALVYLVGVVEVGGGLLLVIGLLTRPAAMALAADMIGAIAVSGLARWEVISLTLAPLLLAAMISLIRLGAGARSLDRRMAANLSRGRAASPAADSAS